MRNYSGNHPTVQSVFNNCRIGDINSVRKAFEAGLDINVLDPKSTDSLLMTACRNGHTEIVRMCLNYGAKNDPHPDFGQTALHAAVAEAHLSAAKVILETANAAGAVRDIIDLEDSHGQTPLHIAASIGATDVVELLLFYEAKLSRVDAHAQTALHLCGGSGNQECVAMLLDHGGDELLEHLDVNGNTVLHHASFNGHFECVRLLLETAANVIARNYKGQTAFQLAASRDHHQIMLLLSEYGGAPAAGVTHHRNHSDGTLHMNSPNIGPPPLPSAYPNHGWPHGSAGGPPILQRSMSTPVKQPVSSGMLSHSHQRHVSDSDLPGTPIAHSLLGLSLPRPHTMGSPSGVAGSNKNGHLRFGGGTQQSQPSTPDSQGYVTARNSELKSGYRVLTKHGAEDSQGLVFQSPAFHRTQQMQTPPVEMRNGDVSTEIPGIPVFTKQPIIARQGFTSPAGATVSVAGSHALSEWTNPGNEVFTTPHAQKGLEVGDNRMGLCDSPQQESADYSDHLLIGTFACDSPAKDATSRSDSGQMLYRSPSPRKQPAAVSEGESEFADPLEVFEALDRRWHAYETEEGDPYFLDMEGGHSQWEDPRVHGFIPHYSNVGTDGFLGSPLGASPLKHHNLPPKSPSPKAVEKHRNFGYSSDEGDSGRAASKMPPKINWHNEQSMTDDDVPAGLAMSTATSVTNDVLPKSDRVAAKLSFRTDGKVRRQGTDDSAFSMKVQSLQASSTFSLANDLARDRDILGSQTRTADPISTSQVRTDAPFIALSGSSAILDETARGARCLEYLSIVHAGGSLQMLREAMEAKSEAQSLMLEVFALADEYMLDKAATSPQHSTSPPAADSRKSDVSAFAPTETLESLRNDEVLSRFAKMAGMGVPAGNVLAKMKLESVSLDQRNRLMGVLGFELEPDTEEGGKKKVSNSSFQTLHWNTLPADRLKNSIWSLGADRKATAGDFSEALMAETEMEELEKLFSSTAGAAGSSVPTSAKEVAVKEADLLKVLERKRAQNIAIGLVPFRVFGSHMDMLKAICSLDTLGSKITADHLDNFRNLLPTDAEMKRIHEIAGSKHPAELFVQAALMFYPELPRRLNCFITCLNFGSSCEALMSKTMKIINCCNQVLSSSRLAKLLQKMLAVGNVMNQGTNRGQAAGFTLDSLLKMVDTKGVDKRTSVLDYVVKSLYDKREEKVLDVIDDLQLVDEAAKLSGAETVREFDAIQRNLSLLKSELAHNQVTIDQSSFSSPTAKLIVSHFHTRLETYLDEFRVHSSKLQRWKDVLTRKMPEVLRYFGEDVSSADVTKIFLVLQKFRNALLFCRESTEWKIYRQTAQDQNGANMC